MVVATEEEQARALLDEALTGIGLKPYAEHPFTLDFVRYTERTEPCVCFVSRFSVK